MTLNASSLGTSETKKDATELKPVQTATEPNMPEQDLLTPEEDEKALVIALRVHRYMSQFDSSVPREKTIKTMLELKETILKDPERLKLAEALIARRNLNLSSNPKTNPPDAIATDQELRLFPEYKQTNKDHPIDDSLSVQGITAPIRLSF